MKKKEINDELDIGAIVISVYKNRFKIFLITMLTISLSLIFFFTQKTKFSAVTEINKINIYDESLYMPYNALIIAVKDENISGAIVFNEINSEYLLRLFIEKLEQRTILMEAIDKFKLIDKNEYEDYSL